MNLDANNYPLETIKMRDSVKWIVKKDVASGGYKWFILNVIDNKFDDPTPSRYGLSPFLFSIGKRAYGKDKTKWKVCYDKKSYYWKLIDRSSSEEKDRILDKLATKLNDCMQIYGEPNDVNIYENSNNNENQENEVVAQLLFNLRAYGCVSLNTDFSKEIMRAKILLLQKISMYLFNNEDPRTNKKFTKSYYKFKYTHPEHNHLQICYAILSKYLTNDYGFKNKGSFLLNPNQTNEFCILQTKNKDTKLMNLNTNIVHRECLRLLQDCNVWEILKKISIEYFSPFDIYNQEYKIDCPHIVPDTSEICFKYIGNKSSHELIGFTQPTSDLENNSAINIIITEQDNTSIHLGWILFSHRPEISKLIKKYLSSNENINNAKFQKIIMRYWRTWSNGMVLYSSNICYYEAIPHNITTNKKILLRCHIENEDKYKSSLRFNLQFSNVQVPFEENMDMYDRIKLCALLESNFELGDYAKCIKIKNNKKKTSEYEKNNFKNLLTLLDSSPGHTNTTSDKIFERDIEKKILTYDYKFMCLGLPRSIKEMYGIYNFNNK